MFYHVWLVYQIIWRTLPPKVHQHSSSNKASARGPRTSHMIKSADPAVLKTTLDKVHLSHLSPNKYKTYISNPTRRRYANIGERSSKTRVHSRVRNTQRAAVTFVIRRALVVRRDDDLYLFILVDCNKNDDDAKPKYTQLLLCGKRWKCIWMITYIDIARVEDLQTNTQTNTIRWSQFWLSVWINN